MYVEEGMSFWRTLTSPGQKCSNFSFHSKVAQNHMWNIYKPMHNGPIKIVWYATIFSMSFWRTLTSPGENVKILVFAQK